MIYVSRRTIAVLLLLFIASLFCVSCSRSADAQITSQSLVASWDASPSFGVVSYRLYCGVDSGDAISFALIGETPDLFLQFDLGAGAWLCGVTAWNGFSESVKSALVRVVVEGPALSIDPPSNLVISFFRGSSLAVGLYG